MNRQIDVSARKSSHVCVPIAVVLAIAFFGVATARALDITTAQGKTYTDVQVRRVEPDGISIKHSCGIDKILFRELTPEDRARFHLDASGADAYSEAQRKSIEAARLRQEEITRKENAERAAREAQREIEAKQRKAKQELQDKWNRAAREYLLYCDTSWRDGKLECHGTNNVEYVIYGYTVMPKTWFRVKAASVGRVQTGPSTTAIQLMLDPSRYPLKHSQYNPVH